MASKTFRYLFGPVPSRRLGRSLGVDVVPMKTCTQNCLYCQLGKDAPLTLERKDYVPIEAVLQELGRWLGQGQTADFITLSGSGEPTLHSRLGELIDGIRSLTEIRVAVITNGTLLSRPDVRRDCAKADVVLPSLDAGDEPTFRRLNRPHSELDFKAFVEGLCLFRNEYAGQLWLEVFFCEGINTDHSSIENIARQIEKIRPDKIQLNTAVRPTSHAEARPVSPAALAHIARMLHPDAEVIAEFRRPADSGIRTADAAAVLDMVRRHPCTLEDICGSLSLEAGEVREMLTGLMERGEITKEHRNGTVFYR